MAHSRTLILKTGRSVRLTFDKRSEWENDHQSVESHIQVMIKEANEVEFHSPIGICHPRYWKLKGLSAEQAARLQLLYSGLSSRQIAAAVKEFTEAHAILAEQPGNTC